MRIRSIKPEFWRSDDIAALDLSDRLLFIGLWSYVDDSGAGVDKLPHICADLFASDLERNPLEVYGRVRGGLENLAARNLIIRYEADGKHYLYVTNWQNHQRIDKPSRARFPLPAADSLAITAIPEVLPEPSRNPPVKVAPGTEEQRNRGTEEQGTKDLSTSGERAFAKAAVDELFESAWIEWPKRTNKEASRTKFTAAAKTVHADNLAALVIDFGRAYAATTELKFTPGLNVWLNAKRWTDPLPVSQQPDRKPTRGDNNLAYVQGLYNNEQQQAQWEIEA